MSTQFYGYGSFEEFYGPDEPMPEAPEPAVFTADDDARDLDAEKRNDALQVERANAYNAENT